jgi:hypothetical protein
MKFPAVLLAMMLLPAAAQADMLERQTARFIRNAGYWCDRVSDMRVDKRQSTQVRRVVLVTCYDVRHFAQYELVLGSDNKVRSIRRL